MEVDPNYDFSGYATRNDRLCSDGRTIRAGAFKHQDGQKVPLLYQHGHGDAKNVLGHAILENRDDGVYAYAYLNHTDSGKDAKILVQHGDITHLSIFANELVERAKNVIHGKIRELSIVLAGANPGAFIDNVVLAHGDTETVLYDEAIIYNDDSALVLAHSSIEGEVVSPVTNSAEPLVHADDPTISDVFESMNEEQQNVTYFMIGEALRHSDDSTDDDITTTIEHADGSGKTVKDIFDSMTEEQQNVVYFMIGEALDAEAPATAVTQSEDLTNSETLQHDQEGTTVHNLFENNGKTTEGGTLSHAEIQVIGLDIFKDFKSTGSMKEAVNNAILKHGIENIDVLFPDAKAVTNSPEFIKRRTEWVDVVMSGTNHTPFSRIKSMTADITLDEARAKGYIKGNFKKEEFFSVAKRVTTPQTIYKKQKLDRDDILDITDFDVVAWLKGEMRLMLEEELARAILIGDGRSNADEDKINETMIRPIASDSELYQTTVYVNIDDADSSAEEVIDALTLHRRHYRGSGNPTFFTSETMLSKMLMIKDGMKRRIYPSVSDLQTVLRVSSIVTVEVFEDAGDLVGIMVNLNDYTVGADKGGNVTMFDDFDIDYNQQKYLIETRVSGALVRFKSALVVRKTASNSVLVVPGEPAFAANSVTVPTKAGVTYKNKATGTTLVTGTPVVLAEDETLTVIAVPTSSAYYFATSADDEWTFEYVA